MPERPRRPMPAALGALVLGLALAALTWFGGWPALAGAWLAQPALALAVSWQARTRAPARKDFLRRDLVALLALWAVGFGAVGALLAWPLQALRSGGSLGAALGLSAVAGACLVGLWRTWPLWQRVESEGGGLARQWRAMAGRDAGDWHGLGVAAAVAAAIGFGLSLAWPALWPGTLRGAGTLVYVVALPLLHWGLQRAPRAGGLPVLEMPARPAAAKTVAAAAAAPAPAVGAPLRAAPTSGPAQDAALYEAARSGRVERALELIDSGANPRALPPADARDQRSLAVLAAVLPDLRLLRQLIARGIDLNHAHAGMTPLLAATRDSWHGRPDAVTTLLTNGADPRQADRDGNTPLHHAARSSDPGVAALLRDAAAELDARNGEGVTPLGIACAAGNWRLARFLLERGAKAEPAGAQPALLAAAGTEEDDPAGVQLLLRHKARVDTRGAHGRSALHEAARAGHAEILAALLAAGATVEARDQAGITPWLDAVRSGDLAAVDVLAAAGADLHARDAQGRNAVLLACSGEQVSAALVGRLLELGLDPAQRSADGQRAVDVAAAAGRWALVSQLDPAYVLPNAVAGLDHHQPPPDQAPLGLLREALERGEGEGEGEGEGLAALARLCSPAELGSLLHAPALSTSPRVLAWLLRHGAPGEALDVHGDVPLLASLARGPAALAATRVLLDAGLAPAGGAGLARFLAACVQADAGAHPAAQALALELLQRGADPFAATPAGDRALANGGDPPLSLAVRLDWGALVEALLALGVDREARDARGMSALHLATALGNVPMVRRLIAGGASPDARAGDGQTPLGVALSSGRRDLADWLDWRGWALPQRPLRAGDLPLAAIAGDVDAVRRLLELGFDVDSLDAQGCSALLRAAGGGHVAVVDLLLARGADPQRAARTGATPLSAAVSMRQGAIVNALLQAGADIEYRLPGEVSVLMLGAALGLPDIAARLLTAGADVHARDAQGLSALHCAGLFGFISRDRSRLLALLDTLLLAGAEPDGTTPGTVTPLLLLLGARAEPGTGCDEDVILAGLERLLDEEVALDARDPRGFGPLHLAALHGLLRVVQRLLRAGADQDLRDALGRSPREIAIMRGFVDVAGELAPTLLPGSGAPIARYLRNPH